MSRLSRGVADTQLGPGKELLHELVPTATLTAVLVNKSNPNTESQTRDLQAAARSLGLQLYVLQTRACIQLGGVCRERNRIKRGTPFYDPELGVILGIPKSVVE